MNSRPLIISGSGIVILILWFFFAYSPMKQQISQIKDKIDQANAQLVDFQTTLDKLPEYLKTSQDLEEFRLRLSSSLYAKTDILALLDRLRIESKSKGLAITEITPPVSELLALNRDGQSSDAPQFLNLGLKIEGNFVQFGKFVELLENAPYFRGINFCLVSGSTDPNIAVTYTVGFRALLAAGGKS